MINGFSAVTCITFGRDAGQYPFTNLADGHLTLFFAATRDVDCIIG
jgi:hypothetical protein